MKNIINSLRNWFPLAITITMLTGLLYISIKQISYFNSFDPQLQMAEDNAISLRNGIPFTNLVTGNKVEMQNSLAPFLVIFNEDRKLIISGATLNDKDPFLSTEVFDLAKKRKEHRFIWEPQKEVRAAAVLKYYEKDQTKGYVLAARSVREIENQAKSLAKTLVIGWMLILGVSFFATNKYWR